MSQIANPLSETTRGKLYIVGIVVAIAITPVIALLEKTGNSGWITFAVAVAGAIGAVTNALAKKFLSPSLEEIEAVEAKSNASRDLTSKDYEAYLEGVFADARREKTAKHAAETDQ